MNGENAEESIEAIHFRAAHGTRHGVDVAHLVQLYRGELWVVSCADSLITARGRRSTR
jgi:hypothetical protein